MNQGLWRFPFAVLAFTFWAASAAATPDEWRGEWPRTDFSRHSIDYGEIKSGGPPKDGIPAIDDPRFERLKEGRAEGWTTGLADTEPVISLSVGVDARAYPLRVLIWHEIVNDIVGGEPVAVTYCPLCNAALVFQRTVNGRVLDFGTTGKLRNSDLVMYDRQTESWWQQFTGEAIIGELTGAELKLVPSRLLSFKEFAAAHPDGRVLIPPEGGTRDYGRNPYIGYDRAGQTPFLFTGETPENVDPMERVVAIEVRPGQFEAWAFSLLRQMGEIRRGDLVIRWRPGQASPLDAAKVADGRDVGSVDVSRLASGASEAVPFDTPFAFAFHAFRPGSPIHVLEEPK